ncbi:MAG: family 78 glycoside hydrolase catalytic domain [Clostridia bacterium]|nr:family 78 glycoside hydrolase catalytic domain [Clostridia bacterium]
MLQAINLTCESQINPLGLDITTPRFSWRITSKEYNTLQSAYRIQVYPEGEEKPCWDSGRISGRASVLIPYEGPALRAQTRYFWQVRVWDQKGRDSGWSERAWWETGLMKSSGFQASWISNPNKGDISVMQPVPMFRKKFEIKKDIVRARMYASALGVYTLYINGKPVSEDLLSPGYTSYNNRIQYQTWDVTDLLKTGENAVAASVGDGWYRSYLGGGGTGRNRYGQRLGLICQMHIMSSDGTETVIRTDDSWKAYEDSPIRYSDIYMGVCYDARKEQDGWNDAGFDDSAWQKAVCLTHSKSVLTAQLSQPVRRQMALKPIRIITTPKGETVLDMGQNMVGWLKFTVRGAAGHTVTVHHGEVLDKDGNFYNDNYRDAKSEIIYTLRGEESETFEPMHTFFGFRYAKLIDWPCEVRAEDFEGVVVCSDMEITSGFECSDERVNQLFSNIQWGQRGNFVDIPTDCPQRDERVGWTGDCQAFARTACINMDSHLVLAKWLGDLAIDQAADGGIPHIVPRVFSKPQNFGSAAWGDAATIVPWTLYQCYGDKDLLRRQYPSMRRWLDYIDSQSTAYLWDSGKHFGDWLALDAYEGSYVGATDKALIATAFSAYSTRLTMQAAEVLGYEKDKQELSQLLKKIIRAYRREFITPNGRLAVRTQTAYVLTLYFDLAEEADRPRMARELVELIAERGGHLSTGFVGTPYLCLALTAAGAHDVAGQLLMKSDYPSWLYPITKGATTMWEHWDGIKPDGSFWSRDMNSYNHYAYGAIGEWMMRALAGIDMIKPAYGEILLHPRPIEELSFVSAWQKTPYGKVRCEWRIEGGLHSVHCTVPAGTTAVLVLEQADLYQVSSGEKLLTAQPGVIRAWQSDDDVMVELGSGKYQFKWRVQNG